MVLRPPAHDRVDVSGGDDMRLNHTGSSYHIQCQICQPVVQQSCHQSITEPLLHLRCWLDPWQSLTLEKSQGPSVETTGKTSPPAGDHVVSDLKMATKRSEFRIWLTSKIRDMRSYRRILYICIDFSLRLYV